MNERYSIATFDYLRRIDVPRIGIWFLNVSFQAKIVCQKMVATEMGYRYQYSTLLNYDLFGCSALVVPAFCDPLYRKNI